VLVHQASFTDAPKVNPSTLTQEISPASPPVTGVGAGSAALDPYYFIKITNLSHNREIEITHVWFEVDPPVHLLLPERPLPARLRPDETWEGWVNAAALAKVPNVESLGRVRLANGKTVKSRRNKDVPPFGFVAGAGNR
jgi:hypothetical protein